MLKKGMHIPASKEIAKGITCVRSVPWATWSEWQQVYSGLFGSDAELKALSVKRIRAWGSRGKVPVSVEATASLVEIQLVDTTPATRSSKELQLMYSMALTRFVNGLADSAQRGAYATSVGQIAARMGLPQLLVDLRHGATHSRLPALSILRSAASTALHWLDERYWQPQHHRLACSRHNLRALLQSFQSLKTEIQHLRLVLESTSAATSSLSRQNALLKEKSRAARMCLKTIILATTTHRVKDYLVPTLLDDGFLVPPPLAGLTVEAVFHTLTQLWEAALQSFNSCWPDFVAILFLAIVKRLAEKRYDDQEEESEEMPPEQEKQEEWRLSMLHSWVQFLLDKSYYLTSLQQSNIAPFAILIQSLLRNPIERNVTLAYQLVGFVQDETMPVLRSKIDRILSLRTDTPAPPSLAPQPKQDLAAALQAYERLIGVSSKKTAKKKQKTVTENSTSSSFSSASSFTSAIPSDSSSSSGGWQLAKQVWHDSPLGMLPGQTFPKLDLPPSLDAMHTARYLEPIPPPPIVEHYEPPPAFATIQALANVVAPSIAEDQQQEQQEQPSPQQQLSPSSSLAVDEDDMLIVTPMEAALLPPSQEAVVLAAPSPIIAEAAANPSSHVATAEKQEATSTAALLFPLEELLSL
ncbi:rRNA-processing protein las1 [Balamuthia mandrillaris]